MSSIFTVVLLILIVCFHRAYFQVTTTLETSRPFCGKEIELRCTYTGASGCCDPGRVWRRDGTQIMSDGSTAFTKYRETINAASKYFSLIISNSDDSDYGKEYVCVYGVSIADPYTLNDKKCDPSKLVCGLIDLAFSLLGTAMVEIIFVICILCSKCVLNLFQSEGMSCKHLTIIVTITSLVSAAVGAVISIPVGYSTCHCDCHVGYGAFFILLGILTDVVAIGVSIKIYQRITGGPSESNGSCWPPCRIEQEPSTTETNNRNRSDKEAHTIDLPKKKRPLPPLDDKSPVSSEITPRPLPKLPPINKN